MKFDAVYMMRDEIYERYPELKDVLNKIKIDNAQMSHMNYQVEAQGNTPQDVAKEFLKSNGLIV